MLHHEVQRFIINDDNLRHGLGWPPEKPDPRAWPGLSYRALWIRRNAVSPSSSCISHQFSLAHIDTLLRIPLDCADLFEEAKDLGVYDSFFDLLEEVGYPPPEPPIDPSSDVEVQENPYYGITNEGDPLLPSPPRLVPWWHSFIHPFPKPSTAEMVRAIEAQWERLNQKGKSTRERLLSQLADRGCPPDGIRRVKELCLLAELCLTVQIHAWDFWMKARRLVLPIKRRYRILRQQLMKARLSEDVARRAVREIDILLKLLDAYFPTEEQQKLRNKVLGIDKRTTLPPQKQRIWSQVFRELVDLLRPYHGTEEQTFQAASRLMHLSHPTLWPDRPDLVKQRYYSSL
jgi:hypothetical protein